MVAAALGKEALVVSTDLRPSFNYFNDWVLMHGAALASVGHFLTPRFSGFYIAASNSYLNLPSLGLHPVLDPLWSNETLNFVHARTFTNQSRPTIQRKL